jgi:hypothetical protein
MGTFQRTETVDARQFTGGKQNGTDLALWVNSNGQQTETRAEWFDALKAYTKSRNTPEFIYVRSYTWRERVYVGDWIIWKQDGTFDHMRDQDFIAAGYVQA